MKKIKNIVFSILLILFSVVRVEALSVDKNEITIKKGENSNISLYANVGELKVNSIEFSLVYTTYDVPANFKVDSSYKDVTANTKHKISFDNPITGKVNLGNVAVNVVDNPKDKKGTINITGAKAYTKDGEVKTLNAQFINVTVDDSNDVAPTSNEEITNTNENTSLLKSIESDIVDIKLKEGVYEYTVRVKEDIKELDLKPVLNDDSYKAEVSNQKIEELEEGKITIAISKDDTEVVYTINVKVDKDIEVDDSKFVSSYSYKNKWIAIIVLLSVVIVVGILFIRKKR